jgi:hypothetical protein
LFFLEAEFLFPKAAKNKNTSMIRLLYSKLKREVARNLGKVVEDMGDFHECILDLFDASGESIRAACDVKKVFEVLTEKSYWSFIDVSNLEGIVEEFGGELKEQCLYLINQYKEELNGFKTATKITEFIERNKNKGSDGNEYASLKEEKEKYDVEYRNKLSVKLAGSRNTGTKISMESLLYVEKLWNSLCLEFNLPSLPHTLDDIINGSVIIHWLIQHRLTWKILEKISDSVEFFKREAVANVSLEGVCIYNQKTGIRDLKVRYAICAVRSNEAFCGTAYS